MGGDLESGLLLPECRGALGQPSGVVSGFAVGFRALFCRGLRREDLERNDFIIEKQKAELQRIEAIKRHKEQQVNLAEQELRQVKSEIRTDKLKSAATDAATVIASGVGSLFGSGKMKKLEQSVRIWPFDFN